MRAASREHTPMWMASRGIAGTRGRTLIVNFPGNPPAIEQAGGAIAGLCRTCWACSRAAASITERRFGPCRPGIR